jgi:hypothetical protein
MSSEKDKFLKEENTPTNYVAIRVIVTIVQVKRRFGLSFWTEKELGKSVAIPDDHKKAVELYNRLLVIMKEYGVTLKETT